MIQKNDELLREITTLTEDSDAQILTSGDDLEVNELREVTLEDLGEINEQSEENPEQKEITADQMDKMIRYFNGKINHIKKQENKLIKRRTRNKASKKSRKKNRSK